MIINIDAFSSSNKELFKHALDIRQKVFVEEQNVPADINFDGNDFNAIHYIVIVDNQPVGTARVRELDDSLKIERMAILKNFRHLGLGFLLMKFILTDILPAKKSIFLHAQKQTVDFYKYLGFSVIGDFFYEAGIPHIKMIYNK